MFYRLTRVFVIFFLIMMTIDPQNGYAVTHSGQTDKNQAIKVTFAGDLMLDWSIKNTIKKYGSNYPFKQIKTEVSTSDIAVANLEMAVTKGTVKFPKTYNFKADPDSVSGITNAGFDLVSLANNHSMDYMREGLLDTMNGLQKQKLAFMGAGKNSAEAYQARTFSIKGKKLAFLGFSGIIPDKSWLAESKRAGIANGTNLNTILATIKKEQAKADYVFVYLHWGIERNNKPEPFQRVWARKMIDAGADAIIGSHPHVLQGFEYYKGKPIAYSLGNFLFPDYVKGEKAQTGLLHLELQSGRINMSFTPYYIYKDQIRAQDWNEKRKVWLHLQSLSTGVKIDKGNIAAAK